MKANAVECYPSEIVTLMKNSYNSIRKIILWHIFGATELTQSRDWTLTAHRVPQKAACLQQTVTRSRQQYAYSIIMVMHGLMDWKWYKKKKKNARRSKLQKGIAWHPEQLGLNTHQHKWNNSEAFAGGMDGTMHGDSRGLLDRACLMNAGVLTWIWALSRSLVSRRNKENTAGHNDQLLDASYLPLCRDPVNRIDYDGLSLWICLP